MRLEDNFNLELVKRGIDDIGESDRILIAKKLADLYWREKTHSHKMFRYAEQWKTRAFFWQCMTLFFLMALVVEAWIE